ncbi:MAG: ABC transporter permease [Chloroflexi bacterium]|nr:ABC transporter permease [Chloroflexota bacterium]
MSRERAYAIALRVVRQFLHDRRTLALMAVAPLLVMSLVGVSIPKPAVGPRALDLAAPALLPAMAMFFGFILTGISFLRERVQGTFERMMASPVARSEVVAGYLTGLLLFALAQALIILLFTVFAFDLQYRGALWQVFVVQALVTLGSVNMGIFFSTFARTEFQVVQFIPVVMVSQVLLSGVLWPVSGMPGYLQGLSRALPLTYAVRAMEGIMLAGKNLGGVGTDLLALGVFAVAMALFATLVLRRRMG